MARMSDWLKRELEDPEVRLEFEREKLVLAATEGIWKIMSQQNISKSAIARTLDVSRAHIGQILSGSRNMTLRSLASLAYACGFTVHHEFRPMVAFAAGNTQTLDHSEREPPSDVFGPHDHPATMPGGDQPRAPLLGVVAMLRNTHLEKANFAA